MFFSFNLKHSFKKKKKIKRNFKCYVYNNSRESPFVDDYTYSPAMFPCKNKDPPFCPIGEKVSVIIIVYVCL